MSVNLVFSHLGFWREILFLVAPFPDRCLLVPFHTLVKQCCTFKMQYLFLTDSRNKIYKNSTLQLGIRLFDGVYFNDFLLCLYLFGNSCSLGLHLPHVLIVFCLLVLISACQGIKKEACSMIPIVPGHC